MVEVISDIGNYRDINEDYLFYTERDNVKLYVIADGMGDTMLVKLPVRWQLIH
jgi:hypothetical protein